MVCDHSGKREWNDQKAYRTEVRDSLLLCTNSNNHVIHNISPGSPGSATGRMRVRLKE
jgi:hypothetical protein